MTDELHVDPADIAPLDRPKVAAALARVRLAEIRDPDTPAFHAAYDLLAGHFLASGELEDRDHIADFVTRRTIDYGLADVEGTYHLVGAFDGDTLVGVRDCYVDIDHTNNLCLVALAHVCVTPEWRRSGLAAALRTLPLAMARGAATARAGRPLPTLMVAEMEPADPDDPATVIRLLAYGRSGFAALDPRRVPYSQPEFRDLDAPSHTGIPLLGVVRTAGLAADPHTIPEAVAAAFPRLFHVCHRMFLPHARVDPSEQHVLRHLLRGTPVPLLPLPTDLTDLDALAPLVRGAVLPLYPPALRGPNPTFDDPTRELRRLRAAWSSGQPVP